MADQIADKVCAILDSNYPGGIRSSRVKDLVDLVVLAHTQTVDLAELRQAIAAKRVISGLGPIEHFEIPNDWTRTYPTTSKGVPVAESFTAEAAADLVALLVDRALDKRSITGIWNPRTLSWVADTSDSAATAGK